MKEILKCFKKDRFRVYLVILISLITYYLTLYPVNQVGSIIDRISKGQITREEFLYQIVYLLLAAISLYLVFYFKEYFIFIGEYNAQHEIGQITLNKIYRQTSIFFNKIPISDVISIIINDVTNYISFFFSIGLLFFVEGVVYNLVLTLVILYKSNLLFTFLVILPFIIQTLILVLKRKKQSEDYQKMTASMDLTVKNTLENIKGIRVVRAYNMVKLIRNKFIANINEYANNLLSYVLNFAILQPLILISKSFSYLVLVVYGYYLVSIGATTIGNLVSISIILAMLSWPYAALSELILRIRELKQATKRVNRILEASDTVFERENTKELEFSDSIEFKNFSFRYEDNLVLDDISFKLEKGKTLAIVGKTGSGKTTLIKQILRFYEIQSGDILIDGKSIREYSTKSIRKNIGYVPQEHMLFSKSIRENILFYRPLSDKIPMAVHIVDLESDIIEFKNGLGSMVGENGLSLSGGQKQRIQIARAIISEPNILILDDSLSAVDANTEKIVLARLKENRKEKTNIVVSHRVSVVKDADEILVMSNGKIIDRGTHNELISRDGWYRNLYEYQYSEGDNK